MDSARSALRGISVEACFTRIAVWLIDGVPQTGVDLKAGAPVIFDLVIKAEVFFRDDVKPDTAKLRFAPFADADSRGNGDGFVALDELGNVPLDELRRNGSLRDRPWGAVHRHQPAVGINTLEDYVYVVLFGRGHSSSRTTKAHDS